MRTLARERGREREGRGEKERDFSLLFLMGSSILPVSVADRAARRAWLVISSRSLQKTSSESSFFPTKLGSIVGSSWPYWIETLVKEVIVAGRRGLAVQLFLLFDIASSASCFGVVVVVIYVFRPNKSRGIATRVKSISLFWCSILYYAIPIFRNIESRKVD